MKKKLLVAALSVAVSSVATMAWAGAERISSLPYTVTESGAYRVDDNLSSNGHGIILGADNVKIDLQGYTISGDGTAGEFGINLNGHSNVLVQNGTITNFDDGVHGEDPQSGPAANSNRVVNVSVVDNVSEGIFLHGFNHLVKDCVVTGNAFDGIHLQYGGIISGNLVYSNGGDAISSHGGTVVSGNSIVGNTQDGIDVDMGSTIIGNTVFQNGTNRCRS